MFRRLKFGEMASKVLSRVESARSGRAPLNVPNVAYGEADNGFEVEHSYNPLALAGVVDIGYGYDRSVPEILARTSIDAVSR